MIRFLFFVIGLIIDTIIAAFLAILGGIFNPYSKYNTTILRGWAKTILLLANVKIEVEGLEHISSGESYIVIANHQSHMDIPILVSSLPLPVRIIAKKELFKIPVFGWGMSGIGIIKIDRSNRSQAIATLKNAEKIIRENSLSILAFPEGTRSRDGKIHPFKKGPFILAINTQLPLLPVSVSGTRQILPKGKVKINPGKVKIIVHPPISTKDVDLKTRNQIVEQSHQTILEGFEHSYSYQAAQHK